ncbi:MAG: tRNA preQ1(34) S-adenosylmethionine ribosyltransferase-isomerase QueA [Geminicoccaceae bacterium]|nr:tRNA preQ1(34) S-adenosylmethionine ribosyltransferase-isomerase QueA [Geminicoccaceae bacterium]
MRIDLFDFELPSELIAQHPVEPREAARLLVVGDRLEDRFVGDLPELLDPGDLVVLNDTRVLPTRFWGRRGTAAIEATLVEPKDERRWWALARPGRRLRAGDRVELGRDLGATVEAKDAEGRVLLCFDRAGEELLAAIRAQGAMPLPPYIKRPRGGDPRDLRDYQPVLARKEGSVAAPTASLHLTPALLDRLERRGIERAFVTLHVGLGTFAPVKVRDTREHRMHEERGEIPSATSEAIARTRARGGRVVAVGTTVLRTLESRATDDGGVESGPFATALFVTPGFRFRVVDRLLTNFHLPRSTLFMLVCAFAGYHRMRRAYAHAVAQKYRFFSYGDACLLDRHEEPPPE